MLSDEQLVDLMSLNEKRKIVFNAIRSMHPDTKRRLKNRVAFYSRRTRRCPMVYLSDNASPISLRYAKRLAASNVMDPMILKSLLDTAARPYLHDGTIISVVMYVASDLNIRPWLTATGPEKNLLSMVKRVLKAGGIPFRQGRIALIGEMCVKGQADAVRLQLNHEIERVEQLVK